jgi:hypothetical protein
MGRKILHMLGLPVPPSVGRGPWISPLMSERFHTVLWKKFYRAIEHELNELSRKMDMVETRLKIYAHFPDEGDEEYANRLREIRVEIDDMADSMARDIAEVQRGIAQTPDPVKLHMFMTRVKREWHDRDASLHHS